MSSDTNLALDINNGDTDKAGRLYSESAPGSEVYGYELHENLDDLGKDKQDGAIPAQVGPPRKYSGFAASSVNLLKSIIGAGTLLPIPTTLL